MSVKREVQRAVDDVRDAVNEAGHRTAAEAEQTKRDVAGDQMTPGERVASGLNEGRHRVQAEVDRTKRNVRDAV